MAAGSNGTPSATLERDDAPAPPERKAGETTTDLVGRRLLHFHVVERLGEGGMGIVYKAIDEKLRRPVALKVLLPRYLADERNREMIFREARSAAAVTHPNIAAIYEVHDEGDLAFYAMELVVGETLRARIAKGGRVPIEEALRWGLAVARALARAHAAGVVHRDLKADNVMITPAGEIKLLDFGLAKVVDVPEPVLVESGSGPKRAAALAPTLPASGGATERGRVMGTPAYMAPEQARGEPVDARADVFAFGVLLYEMVTGKAPFTHRSGMPWSWGDAGSGDWTPAARVRQIVPRAPREVEQLFERCVAFAPAGRYEDGAALAAAIERCAHGIERRRRLRAAAIALGGATAILGGVAWGATRIGADGHAIDGGASARAPASLVPEATVLACPQLDARGVDEPAGWLGAAAASLACARAELLLGGRSDRTLAPAELLDLPAEPVEGFPHDPYGAPDARNRALEAARERATAYLDGSVERARDDAHVLLVLHAKDGRELARGEGSSPRLYRAVDAAMEGLRAPGALPDSDQALAPARDWLGAASVTTLFALEDAAVACRLEDHRGCTEECAKLSERKDLTPAMEGYARGMCALAATHRPPDDEIPPFDAASTGAVIASAASRLVRDRRGPEVDDAIAAALDREKDRQARATLVCLRADATKDPASAREQALLALKDDPQDGDPRCYAWHKLPFVTADSSYGPAYAAWAPWDPLAQDRLGDFLHDSLPYARRAYLLAPESFWANSFCSRLLSAGMRVEAASVLPQTTSPGLRITILAAEARFGAALDRTRELLAAPRDTEAKYGQHIDIALVASNVALVLGRPLDFAEPLVQEFLDRDRPILAQSVSGILGLVAVCTLAPRRVAEPCLARLDAYRAKGELPTVFPLLGQMIAGAKRYAAGDWAGATAAWKPLLRAPGDQVKVIMQPVAIALEKSGDLDLADLVDTPKLDHPGRFNGADLSYVRAARRAMKRGDRARAAELARRVIDAWQVADADVPAVAEMKALLARATP